MNEEEKEIIVLTDAELSKQQLKEEKKAVKNLKRNANKINQEQAQMTAK